MPTVIHFINVGQGNMVLVETSNGMRIMFDCNLTGDSEGRVLSYLGAQIGFGSKLDAFICSHRDADHMRGIQKLHSEFPISTVLDSDFPGTTTDSSEYLSYMNLRRTVGYGVIKRDMQDDLGHTRLRYLSAVDDRLPSNANAQGIVIKVEHMPTTGGVPSSAMLTGDSDAATWRDAIMKDYSRDVVSSSILMGAHHGSISFFDDPRDEDRYYSDHLAAISPEMTLISVGRNVHGHPDPKALEYYELYSRGSNNGNKVFRTDQKGTMKLTLTDDGKWSLAANQ